MPSASAYMDGTGGGMESKAIASKEEAKYYPFSGIYKWARESFWMAGQDSYTLPPTQHPDMFMQLTNTEPVTRGVLQRRRGYTLFSNFTLNNPFSRAYAYRNEQFSLRRLVWTSGTVNGLQGTVQVTDETGTNLFPTAQLFTPALGARPPRMVLSRDFGYFADGVAADSLKWDGTTTNTRMTNWGIALNSGVFGPNNSFAAADQGGGSNSGNTSGTPGATNAGTIVEGTVWTLGATNTVNLVEGNNSSFLRYFTFGFTNSNIPSNATITGISVSINRSATGRDANQIFDNGVFLLKAGVIVGNDHSNGTAWNTGAATYGSSSDLWGTTLTPTDITNTQFGVVTSAFNNGVSNFTGTARSTTSLTTMTVYYTVPTVASWSNPSFINGVCDNASATANATTTNTSDLRGTNFGFTTIPTTAAIAGIQVVLRASTSSASVPINLNPIMVKNGVSVGQRKSQSVNSTTLTNYTFGGPLDLWGATWVPGDINSQTTNFGMQFNANTAAGSATINVDCVSITVFTTAGPITFTTGAGGITLISGRTYFYTFSNSKTGHNSTLSPASASTGALSSNLVNLSGIPTPTDTQVDVVNILATADGNDQTTLFLLGSVSVVNLGASPQFVDNVTDVTLLTQSVYQQTDNFGNLHGVANNNPPPLADFPVKHKGRLYMAQGHNIFFSKNLDDVTTSTGSITGKWEEAWPFVNVIDLSEFAETVKALFSDGETLWIATERNIRRLIGDSPSNFQKPEIQMNEVGVLSPEVWKVVFMEGQPVGTVWMTPDFRVIESDFNTYRDVGTPVQDVLNSINPAALSAVHAVYVNRQAFDLYMLHIPTGSNTLPDTVLIYNLRTRKWSTWLPTDLLSASLFNVDVNGNPQWLFSTQAGPLYFWDPNVRQDRVNNTPVNYVTTAQTSWLDCGDFSWWKVLNLIILSSDDINLTLAIDGAVTNTDFLTPTQVLTATTVTPSELRGYLQLPLSTSQARHYWFRLTFQSPASTIQNILTSYHLEVVPFSRF